MSKSIKLTGNNEELIQHWANLRQVDFNDMANTLIGIGYSRLNATSKYEVAKKGDGTKQPKRAKKASGEKKAKKASGEKKAATKKSSKKATKKASGEKKVKRKKKEAPVEIVDDETT